MLTYVQMFEDLEPVQLVDKMFFRVAGFFKIDQRSLRLETTLLRFDPTLLRLAESGFE
jgi:hypothetical protein